MSIDIGVTSNMHTNIADDEKKKRRTRVYNYGDMNNSPKNGKS